MTMAVVTEVADAVATSVATTSQTAGPYLYLGFAPRMCADVAFDGRTDQPDRIAIEGHAFVGDGKPLPDGVIEIWQADATGRYDHPDDPRSGAQEDARSASGFGRVPVAADGGFTFTTVKPGRVFAPDGSMQAPHLVIACFARGLLKHLSTRIYFDDEAEANREDFVLLRVPQARRGSLIATSAGSRCYRWTLTTQGSPDRETVFFEL